MVAYINTFNTNYISGKLEFENPWSMRINDLRLWGSILLTTTAQVCGNFERKQQRKQFNFSNRIHFVFLICNAVSIFIRHKVRYTFVPTPKGGF